MKISQKQANLLAHEIFKRLKRENVAKVDPSTVQKLNSFKKYRDKLIDDKNKIEKEVSEHDKRLKLIVGSNVYTSVRGYHTVNQIVEQMEERNTPSVGAIEDKIILKSMFASEDDMETFVESLVKEFSPKKKKVSA